MTARLAAVREATRDTAVLADAPGVSPGGTRPTMTLDELRKLPTVVPLWPTAGQALGYSRSGAYDAVRDETFPLRVLRRGRRLLVSSIELRRELGDPEVTGVPAGDSVSAYDAAVSS